MFLEALGIVKLCQVVGSIEIPVRPRTITVNRNDYREFVKQYSLNKKLNEERNQLHSEIIDSQLSRIRYLSSQLQELSQYVRDAGDDQMLSTIEIYPNSDLIDYSDEQFYIFPPKENE